LRGEQQRQQFAAEDQPIRQGLMREQLEQSQIRTGGLAHDQSLSQMSKRQQIDMLDQKLKDTNFAGDAYMALNAPDDTQMFSIIQERMPNYLATAQRQGATPEQIRQNLSGILGRAQVLGLINVPTGQKPTSKQSDYQFYAQQTQKGGGTPLSFNDWDRQSRAAGATQVNIGGETRDPTEYEKQVDKRAAGEVVEWTTGGRSRALQNVREFKRIRDDLKSGKINTGTVGDYIPFVSDEVRKIFNEPAAEAVNDIRAIAFQVLRETLGAQFTEKEGERLMATYFDPQLSEQANLKRMTRMVEVAESIVADKDRLTQHMDKNRTAIGFKGIDDPMQEIRDLVSSADEQDDQQTNSKGWQLMTDSNGNQAYVSPDGSQFEEVK
jgi:hypothetical protein